MTCLGKTQRRPANAGSVTTARAAAHAPVEQATGTLAHLSDHGSSISLPFLDMFGSVQAARLKQQGRRFPLFIFDMLTSTRRLRVSRLLVAFTQRTHSQRAIGVMSFHRSWIC